MANKQGYTILERFPVISYALIDRGERTFQRYVAAWIVNEDDPDHIYWAQGHYFTSLLEATDYISRVLTEGYSQDDFDAEFGEDKDDDFYMEKDMYGYNCDRTGVCGGHSCPIYFTCHDAY